jgi:hypothetical protein
MKMMSSKNIRNTLVDFAIKKDKFYQMTQKHTSSPISPFFQLEKWGWKAWQAAA